MKVLLTGASGFLGGYLYQRLQREHQVISLGRSSGNKIQHDLSQGSLSEIENDIDIVIHAAGKAHIYPKTEKEKRLFYEVNEIGTRHLLDSLNKVYNVRQLVFISTVSVYGLNKGEHIDESYPPEGGTPYAESKIQAEKLIKEWGKKHNTKILILRLPLIVGKNPPGNLGKMIAAIKNNRYLSIDRGKAKKSGVLALDVADLVARSFTKEGVFNLTDRYHPSFWEYEVMISEQLGKPAPRNLPLGLAKLIGSIGDVIPGFPLNSGMVKKMTHDLIINDDKAVQELNWAPNRIIDHFEIK